MIAYLLGVFKRPPVMDLSNVESSGIYEILLRVDCKTLIKRCRLVCQQWNNIINQRRFWMEKCEYDEYPLPFKSLASLSLDYSKILILRPFNRNLINDEWSSDTFRMDKRWKFNSRSGRGFEVERPPIFFNGSFSPDFDDELVKCCLATSYFWSPKTIVIDLYAAGIDSRVLDELCPSIEVSELVSHRSDCASVYEMSCWISDRPSQMKDSIGEYYASEGDDDRLSDSCHFKRNLRFEQWQPQNWNKVEGKFTKYPIGMRYVILETKGKDEQFWAGNYGTKMAHCSIVVTTKFNKC